jgi:hypothetical protein
VKFPWKRREDGHRIGWFAMLVIVVLGLTVLAIVLPAADSVLSDPDLRFGLLIAVLVVLVLFLLRALYPDAPTHYSEATELDDTIPERSGVVEKDWLTLYVELRGAARRRLEVRHRLSREEVDRMLGTTAAEELVGDEKLMELLTCDLKRRYLWPGADLEGTFIDLLRRVEGME